MYIRLLTIILISFLALTTVNQKSLSQKDDEPPRIMAERLQREIDQMRDKILLEDPSPEEAESLKHKIEWNTTKLNQMMPGKIKISGNKERHVEKTGIEKYTVISKNNLFFPLGYGSEEKRFEFVLTGILGRTALIQIKGSPESYYVTEGESFGKAATLIEIDKDRVVITYENRELTLKLGKD